ncbi:DUF4390 domain-containing protein [Nitrospina sp. 32_T5]|uniref:DUF4390 domain-containing protein n=1 Tax=unclassified Nitrospina TaxID=2638683 RepID=UPI003F95A483
MLAQTVSGCARQGILILLCIGFMVIPAWAKPVLSDVTLRSDHEQILVDGTLHDAFTDKMMEALHSGVPLTFHFKVELRRHLSFYPDEMISQKTITHTVQYDTLKKTYEFSSQGDNMERKVVTRKSDLCRELMMTLKDIPLSSIYLLDPDEWYYVRVKAEMINDDGLWFPFNWLLFFVPIHDFETSWTESSLIQVEPNKGFPADATQPLRSPSGTHGGGLNNAVRAFSK